MIIKIQKAIVNTIKQYKITAAGEYGVNEDALAQILTTEVFKEVVGVGKPIPAKKPEALSANTVPAMAAAVTAPTHAPAPESGKSSRSAVPSAPALTDKKVTA